MDAFGIIYPQYWHEDGADKSFAYHFAVLKKFYAFAKVLNEGQPLGEGRPFTVPEMLSTSNLDNQAGLFKVTKKSHPEAACGPPLSGESNHQAVAESAPILAFT